MYSEYKTQLQHLMNYRDNIRNVGTLAHVDHGKTTLTDSLLAGSGLLSEKDAGTRLKLDYVPIEQTRQMTVKAANISLLYEKEGKPYLINLVDTPGHVDFTGHVTRSLRAMDGGIVVVDAVEGIKTQTKTVLKQALRERVRPLLYINKVDRLIRELKYTPEQIRQQFGRIINDFNVLIDSYADPEFRDPSYPGFMEDWKVNPSKNQVAFGSAFHRWGTTFPRALEKGITFKDIISAYSGDGYKNLPNDLSLHQAILDMVVQHVYPPHVSQKYRIPKIWKGDLDSEIGQSMLNCDSKGIPVMAVTKVTKDPQAGIVATGRIFSGTFNDQTQVYLLNTRTTGKVNQVGIYMGPTRLKVEEVPAGNIAAMLGLDKARSGETVVDSRYSAGMTPFEPLAYITEPVITMSIEPERSVDLPQLIDALHDISIEDPTVRVKTNEETGETLVSGVGKLHLEIVEYLLGQRTDIKFKTSNPIVNYRETIKTSGNSHLTKSPNRLNSMSMYVQPLDEATKTLLMEGEVYGTQNWRERSVLLKKTGWSTEEARGVMYVHPGLNILVNMTKGVQYLDEITGNIINGVDWTFSEGPLAKEPVRGVKVILEDAKIHTDNAHRGPAQIMPLVKNSILASFMTADPTMLEPVYRLNMEVPKEHLGNALNVIARHRGSFSEQTEERGTFYLAGEIPVAETIELSEELRGATSGNAFWSTPSYTWKELQRSLFPSVVRAIRSRKGLSEDIPTENDFLS